MLNTAASYGRSIFAIVMSLFSTRWVLEALGQSDYGLFGVVGSLIVMITFLNGGLEVGVTRFYSYSIGESSKEIRSAPKDDLKRWFNTAFSIHLILPIILIAVGWPLGEYVIKNLLTVPSGRMDASLAVFRVSLLTAFMTVFSVPFIAMYYAHQRIVELAVFGILRSCSIFVMAWCLLRVSSDRLVVYAYSMAAINMVIPLVQIVRSIKRFPDCRLRFGYMYDREYLKRLFLYVGWKMFGMSCVTMRAQGTPMLINLHFGPLVNAAYQVAFGLSTQATALSQSLTTAFRPAVISAEAKGDREGMLNMALQSCKFGALLVIIFAIPLILEMDNLLVVWLNAPPEYAGVICQWLLLMLIVDRMTTGQMLAVNARGKIALYELIQGTIFLLALPLMWGMFQSGVGPNAIGVALFISTLIYCGGRILFAKYLLDFPVKPWSFQVGIPISVIAIIVSLSGNVLTHLMPGNFMRILLTTALCITVATTLAWLLLFNKIERQSVVNGVKIALSKLPHFGHYYHN
jgi:O-antigen/teichoic acid export membrane protein